VPHPPHLVLQPPSCAFFVFAHLTIFGPLPEAEAASRKIKRQIDAGKTHVAVVGRQRAGCFSQRVRSRRRLQLAARLQPAGQHRMDLVMDDFDEDELERELERELAALGPITDEELKAAHSEIEGDARLPLWDDASWEGNRPVGYNEDASRNARGEKSLHTTISSCQQTPPVRAGAEHPLIQLERVRATWRNDLAEFPTT
jgi:hypothetical protein